jgi:ATP-dependent helicase HrpB
MTKLPIEPILPELCEVLRSRSAAVLQAPPGAGKTTRVPLALLAEPWLHGQRIVMLEPRRLAARAAANRMAASLGERVGETVGYRVRMDTRVSARTRIEVVTEGVLTRMLHADATLDGIGAVIFDEFHERSLHADLGLSLCLQAQQLLRPELRLLVMSATLDGEAVARLLDDAPVVSSEGRSHPVRTQHLAHRVEGHIEPAVARAVLRALDDEVGDVLVFLPGAAEIRRVEERLRDETLSEHVDVIPLYGDLSQAEQDRAILPAPPGRRKIVLATSIAETSLTIECVRVVVDSGRMRVPRYSPRIGMTRLETVSVTRAAADQRRGRAGRLGPGVCYRLWTELEEQALLPHGRPEILDADLAPLALDLAAWGVAEPGELAWLDPPPPAAYAQAQELLRELGALDAAGSLTEHGRRMAELPLHPRLAHLALQGAELGLGRTACELAALLGERDVLRGENARANADLRLRLELLHGARSSAPTAADRGVLQRARAEARSWQRRLGVADGDADIEACGLLLAFAYPDRIAQRRPGGEGRYLLRNGRGAAFGEPQPLAQNPYLVAAELSGHGRESRVFLAAPIELDEIETHFADQIETEVSIAWDGSTRSVRSVRRRKLGALVLREAAVRDADPDQVLAAVLEGIRSAGLSPLPWSKTTRQLQERLIFLHHADPLRWPDASDEALLGALDEWLAPFLYGIRRADELQGIDLEEALLSRLDWNERRELDELAPTHFVVPSGSRIAIDYSDPGAPVLAVRLQEVFGLSSTPTIAGGRVALTMHLLSPARRPVQVTRDLESFWRSGYFEVKKDLKGRYPKHYWPDDPLGATATHRVRPRP